MDVTEDKLLGGRVTLRQPAHGYRAAIDPVLLAAFVPVKAGQAALELGCGTGAALLCLNARVPGLRLSAIERDADMLALARQNAQLNHIEVAFVAGDLDEATGPVDHVFFNPPFFDDHDASPYATRNAAHALDTALADWVGAAKRALGGTGTVTMILSAHQLSEALAALQGSFGAIEVLPVRPAVDKPASRVLIRAVLGRKTKLVLLPDLVLHMAGGGYSTAAEAVLRDAAGLA